MPKYIHTGDRCEGGEYSCTNCGKSIFANSGEQISICNKCASTSFKRTII